MELVDAVWPAIQAVGGAFASAFNWLADAARAAWHAIQSVIHVAEKLASIAGSVGKIGKIFGRAVPGGYYGYGPAVGMTAAGPSLFAGAGTSSAPSSGAGITLNVIVHGNVGDETVIGRRAVAALRQVPATCVRRFPRTSPRRRDARLSLRSSAGDRARSG